MRQECTSCGAHSFDLTCNVCGSAKLRPVKTGVPRVNPLMTGAGSPSTRRGASGSRFRPGSGGLGGGRA